MSDIVRTRQLIVDCANIAQVNTNLQIIRSRLMVGKGIVRIEMTQHRNRRSDRQNRYYWPCFVQPLAEFLRSQATGPVAEDDADEAAHLLLKRHCGLLTIVEINGFQVEWFQSTTRLTTVEFNHYLDRCAAWLATEFSITAPEHGVYHEPINGEVVASHWKKRPELAEVAA